MGRKEPLITLENLKSNIYKNAFGNEPHKFFMVYDDLMDELMVRLNEPEEVLVKFPISDTFALMVDPITLEVMGVQLSEFTKEHLPKFHILRKYWHSKRIEECLSKYQEFYYDPVAIKRGKQKQEQGSYYFMPYSIDPVFATC
jgi:hypothetical protein